jgi:hypothetical protein
MADYWNTLRKAKVKSKKAKVKKQRATENTEPHRVFLFLTSDFFVNSVARNQKTRTGFLPDFTSHWDAGRE